MKSSYKFWIFILLIIMTGAVLTKIIPLEPKEFQTWISQKGAIAPVIFVTILSLSIIITQIPNIPIALAGGAIFGPTTGTILLLISGIIGSTICFMIGRYFKEYILSKIGPEYEFLKTASTKKIAWIIFTTRLIPFMPFDIISYASGITSIKFRHYFTATLIGIIPMTIIFAKTGNMLIKGAIWPYMGLGIVLVLTVAIPLLFGRKMKRLLE